MRERGKLWIRYVPEAREHIRKEKKDEIGMCGGKGTHAKKEKR